LRVLEPCAHAVYNYSIIENFDNPDTQKWIELHKTTDANYFNFYDITQWKEFCKLNGYKDTQMMKIYDELPAPEGNKFPFHNEILQWMSMYVAISKK